jgi:hypothetical protein
LPTVVYPDINVAHALRSTWTAAEFDLRAAARGIVLAIGFHTIYELARAFVSGRYVRDVRLTCGFLAEIHHVEYLPTVQKLIAAEFDLARFGVHVITVLPSINQFATRLELTRLSYGYADRAAAFIARREAAISVDHPRITRENIAALKRLRKIRTSRNFGGECFQQRQQPSPT